MRTWLAIVAGTCLALGVGAAARAADHSRVIEAYAEPAFDKASPVRISPLDVQQAHDPLFRELAGDLYDRLTDEGFKVVPASQPTVHVITLEYGVYNINMRASTESSVQDPSYRMVIVSGWDITDPKAPKLRWQTAVDGYGISMNAAAVVPAMLKAGAGSFGKSRTPKGLNKAMWCADGAPTIGHKISPVCDALTEREQQNQASLLLGLTNLIQAPASSH